MKKNENGSKLNQDGLTLYRELEKTPNENLDKIISSLNDFQSYLSALVKRVCKKELKNGFIVQWTFANNLKRKDLKSYFSANLVTASHSLSRIILKIEKEGVNDVKIIMLKDFVCDLKPFMAYFTEDQNYSWLLTNTNSHITNFYHDLSKNIFWSGNSGDHPEEKLVLANTTPFLIRQNIEYKMLARIAKNSYRL